MRDYYLEEDDEFRIDGKNYITLSNKEYEGMYYIFVNQLTATGVPTNKYEIFNCTNEGISNVKDNDIKKKLLEIFSDDINNKIDIIQNGGGI